MSTNRLFSLGTLAAALFVLGGCASNPSLYNWDSYSPQVYAYMAEKESPQEQIIILERNLETARAQSQQLPPGFHAHLGMLYLQDSQSDKAIAQLNEEKAIFPESATFIDFIFAMLQGKPQTINSPAAPSTATGDSKP